uniref:Dilute domain-containing protein n=1 Tax=Caenorhabditis tropicalis TaxID=1561998 RepID=A0A1I7TXY6_9PELO
MLMSLDSPMLDELLGDIYNKLAKQNQNIQTKDVALAFRTTLQVLAKNSSREENPLTSLSFTRVVTFLLNIVNHFYSQSLMEINMELRSTLAQYEDLCLRVPTETVICVMKMTINMGAQ